MARSQKQFSCSSGVFVFCFLIFCFLNFLPYVSSSLQCQKKKRERERDEEETSQVGLSENWCRS